MSNVPACRAVVAAFLLLGAASTARADWIAWTYNWSASPADVLADNASGGGRISLSDEPTRNVVGDSDIVATNLRTYSNAPASNPDTFTNKPYKLTLSLTDGDSSKSGTAIFSGVFNGTLASDSSNITNAFTSATTVVLDLGAHRFTVTLNSYTPPGPQGSVNAGGIGAHATVTVATILQTPEPASLTLAGLAVPLLWLWSRRRTRIFRGEQWSSAP